MSLLLTALAACSPAITVSPESGSATGHYTVTLSLEVAAAEVTAVHLGGVPAYDLQILDEYTLGVTVQGGPDPGPVSVVVQTADQTVQVDSAFSYDSPADPLFERFYAFGASLTMGVQGGVPTFHGALASPGSVLAVLAGAYLPQPLLNPGLLPTIGPTDIGPPPECEAPSVLDFVTSAALQVIGELSDPETGDFGFQWGRVSPDLMPRNVAIGDSDLADVLYGIPSDDFGQQFLAHLVLDPYGAFGSAVVESQLEVVEQGEPTLVICTDLFGNDVIGALVEGDDIDPARVTPVDELIADMGPLLDRLEATGAEIFLATLPRPSLLPITLSKRESMIAEGMAESDVAALIQEIDDLALAMNEALIAEAAGRATVHIVNLAAAVTEQERDGVQIGSETLYLTQFGGLLSLDGVHFSDTGYALVAEQFALAINDALGLDLPMPDLASVHAQDPWAREALIKGGLDLEACTGS
jgi:lysophospholipase L1-like esterase